jgi:SEC-C motif-containing protein
MDLKICPCRVLDLKIKTSYEQCCGPYHGGKTFPETAEQLMRSRYCAYVVGKIQYIDQTNDPNEKENFDFEAAETWSKQSTWMGLEIVATAAGQKSDSEGEIEFKAHFKTGGKETTHHEVSRFLRDSSHHWYYSEGKEILSPVRRSEPKLGRNDPCSCGSGKKLKKCCGDQAA